MSRGHLREQCWSDERVLLWAVRCGPLRRHHGPDGFDVHGGLSGRYLLGSRRHKLHQLRGGHLFHWWRNELLGMSRRRLLPRWQYAGSLSRRYVQRQHRQRKQQRLHDLSCRSDVGCRECGLLGLPCRPVRRERHLRQLRRRLLFSRRRRELYGLPGRHLRGGYRQRLLYAVPERSARRHRQRLMHLNSLPRRSGIVLQWTVCELRGRNRCLC